MKNIFYLVGGLLLLSGVLHLASLVINPIGPNAILSAVVVGIFGLAYLYIGYGMLRSRDAAVPWAVVVPGIGLLLTLLSANRDTFSVAFMIIDALVVSMTAYLMIAGQGKLGRVR